MAVRGSGELKIEFYAHLSEIKDLYFNQGVVVFTILHKRLVEEYSLSLDYQAFCYYARRELKVKAEAKDENLSSLEHPTKKEVETLPLDRSEPKVVIIETSPLFTKIKKHTRATRECIE